MGKDRAGNGFLCKNLDEAVINSNGQIPSDSLDLLLTQKNSTYLVNKTRSCSSPVQEHGSRRIVVINKIRITKNSNPIPIIHPNCYLATSDIATCDFQGCTCKQLRYSSSVFKNHYIDNLHSNIIVGNKEIVDMKADMSAVDNCANKPVNKDNTFYENGCFPGETFYNGVPIPDIAKSHCYERSYTCKEDNEVGFFQRNSQNKKSLSPMRSSSPYSCGSISSFREPGNISSQNFQASWKSSGGPDHSTIDFIGMYERDNVMVNNLSKQNDIHDVFCSYEVNSLENNIRQGDNRDALHPVDNGVNSVYVLSAQNIKESPCHPHVPVVEENEVNQTTISSNKTTSVIVGGKNEDVKQNIESKSVQSLKNDSLVRISHFLLADNEYKRVIDVRTVTELMNTYTSLKGPIILPFVRQRSYYDQWARFPCGDVSNRNVYSRSNANMTIKCWTLLQAIQNDQVNQMKTNSAPCAPASGNSNKLMVPNPADVTCKSLESIIEHYNQISFGQNHMFSPRVKTPPATPLKNVTGKTSSVQSNSSRSSSGNSNGRQRSLNPCGNQCKDQGNTTSHANDKHSPVPLRKKNSSKQTKCKSNNQSPDISHSVTCELPENPTADENDRGQSKNTGESTYIGNYSCPKEPSVLETSISRAELYSSTDDFKSFTFSHEKASNDNNLNHRLQNNHTHVDQISMCNEKIKREPSVMITTGGETAEAYERDVASSPRTQEKRSIVSPAKEISRDTYDVNTNTVRLNLPHELTFHKNDFNDNSGFFSQGERRGFSHQNITSTNNGMVGMSRRSKSKLILSQMCPKSGNREISLVTSPLHNPHKLKQSLLINEMHCPKDIDGKYPYKRNKTAKDSGRSRSSTSWKSTAHKPPELPTRGYSMCERLEPSENPGGQMTLSPETYRPRSDRQSAVSLANVHFLDLKDLKTMLRKTNTPIPRL